MATRGLEVIYKASEYSKDATRYKELLEQGIEAVKTPPASARYLDPGVVDFNGDTPIAFVGDLHGDLKALTAVLKTMWSIIEASNGLLVFLGDYIDRGYSQLETLATVLLLKILYPENVVLLRGNHEPPTWLTPYPHDYPRILSRVFPEKSKELYETSLRLFDSLPFVFLARERVVAVHGGPPRKALDVDNLEGLFEVGSSRPSKTLTEDILWSDPIEGDIEYTYSPRGAGILYGERVTRKFLKITGTSLLIRGHEAVDGTRWNHRGLVLTVFSSPMVYGLRCAGLILNTIDYSGKNRITEKCIDPYL